MFKFKLKKKSMMFILGKSNPAAEQDKSCYTVNCKYLNLESMGHFAVDRNNLCPFSDSSGCKTVICLFDFHL